MTHTSLKALGLLSALMIAVGCSDSVEPSRTTAKPNPEIDTEIRAVAKMPEEQTWSLRVEARDSVGTDRTTETVGDLITTTDWVREMVTYSASQNPDDFMMFNPQASVLWPGNLVQGNSLEGGVPNAVPISDRANGRVTLAIVSGDASGTKNLFYRDIARMRYSDVNQAMNEILAGYTGGTPAKYSFSQEEIHSASQLSFNIAGAYSGPSLELSAKLGLDFSEERTRIAIKLTQEYFTMVFDDPEGPSGVFGPSVTAASVRPYTGDGNPLCYVSSVTYGRIYYLVYESTASAQELKAALSFAYDGGVSSGSIDSDAEFNQVMQQTSVKIFQVGGDPAAGLSAGTAKDIVEIREFMAAGARFSSTNVGAPISYTVKYLGDATLVRMNNTMTYTVEQKRPVGTSSKPTESDFSLFIDGIQVLSSTDPGGGDGGIKVRLMRTDANGVEHELWHSPVNGGWSEISGFGTGQDKWTAGSWTGLGWATGIIKVPNAMGEKVWIEISLGELDCCPVLWRQETRKIFFGYAGQGNWQPLQQDQPNRELTVKVDDTDLRLRFTLTRNGVDF